MSHCVYQNTIDLIKVEMLMLIKAFQIFQWSQEFPKYASVRNLRPHLRKCDDSLLFGVQQVVFLHVY